MGDWERIVDEVGDVYYYNSKTQETSWTNPDLGDWQEIVADDGDVYYYNPKTGETEWTLPENAAGKQEEVQEIPAEEPIIVSPVVSPEIKPKVKTSKRGSVVKIDKEMMALKLQERKNTLLNTRSTKKSSTNKRRGVTKHKVEIKDIDLKEQSLARIDRIMMVCKNHENKLHLDPIERINTRVNALKSKRRIVLDIDSNALSQALFKSTENADNIEELEKTIAREQVVEEVPEAENSDSPWVRYETDEGEVYYFNPETNESSWTNPEEVAEQ
eukprot:TRINITY_DN777802_c0_g1_i1.p1 TRINITY_DN777802_c0_g1~~TRINITY_DN777802_c0_g1_i1.p1  ORF type:complete len:272 (+),score=80.56 TRINITY_DN777802_c0_g1_i1:81-896(+)